MKQRSGLFLAGQMTTCPDGLEETKAGFVYCALTLCSVYDLNGKGQV